MLYLTSNRLSGTIPTEIGLFPNLSDGLAISDNEFASGTLPTEIGKLTNIDFIDMSLCNLSGAIPSQIGLLTKLDSLNLQMNELTGVVPVELESLQSLTFLLLEYNLLTGDLATSPLCQQLDTFAADCSTGCTCCINSELCR
jgi:Leucine-rich repeat (LRR) protein